MDPLQTDEPLPPGMKPDKKDFEAQIIAGCGTFVAGSVIFYLLAVWPFLVYSQIGKKEVLILASTIGLVPAVLFGIVLCRKGGLAGACAFCGGALTVSVFLYLRIQQVFLEFDAHQGLRPTYPGYCQIAIPVAFAALVFGLTLLSTPRSELSFK